MKKRYILLGLLVVASMVLAACQPAAGTTTVRPNAYIGSGKLDGNGVPSDFFYNLHIRKAFAYAFDWGTFVDDVYRGEAVQSLELPLIGMIGYDPNAPHYTFDLAKSAEEFKLADLDYDGIPAGEDPEGDIWTTGFRMTMLYNEGNTTRQIVSEILAANLVLVNEKFNIEVLALPWPAYLTAQRAYQIPVMTAGWQEDIHDPHNWYQPYITGAYGSRQGMSAMMKDQFKKLVNQGVAATDPVKRAQIYARANKLYYDLAVGIPIVQSTTHNYEQLWVQGRVQNPLFAGEYYYTISKAANAINPTAFTNVSIGDADTFDPALAYDTASGEVLQNVYETLVFYDGERADTFLPMLADSWEVSADGLTYTFHIRPGVTFHEGQTMTPTDVAYSFQRGLLQGGYVSPQLLLSEPFFGVGNDDISLLVDPTGAISDDREALSAADPAALVAACETVKAAIVADDTAGTVTMNLAQSWGPFLATLAQTWGGVLNKEWAIANGTWDGSCDTWQNWYAMTSAEDTLTKIANGTGPFKLDHWTQTQEIVLVRNDAYWNTPAQLERVVTQIVAEWGTRFAMLQAGDADMVDVPVENRSQPDALVAEMRVFDAATNTYLPAVPVCGYDSTKLAAAMFTLCAEGQTPAADKTLRLNIGRPGLYQDVILFNFNIH